MIGEWYHSRMSKPMKSLTVRAKRPAGVKVRTFNVRVPERVLKRLDQMAGQLGMSRNSLCERLLSAACNPDVDKAAASLFSTLGLEDAMKAAAESALFDVFKRFKV